MVLCRFALCNRNTLAPAPAKPAPPLRVRLRRAYALTQEVRMHPRESRTTRRAFLFASGGTIAALSGADALLHAVDALAAAQACAAIGPGGIPLARRNHPL